MNTTTRRFGVTAIAAAIFGAFSVMPAVATEFSEPWLNEDHALVIDAYEYNEIDWKKMATDERIAGFINKASDGLPPDYRCSGDETEQSLCSALWKRYSVARELYHTRKTVAKSMGLKWGAYHLGRPGNPVEQADHFIWFADPGPDDLIALDIEDNDPEKWMSLEDAEIFARRIKARLGRYPILYTNGSTAKYIAQNRDDLPLLSRLPLWYARYKPEIGEHFPKGNWDRYALWQFSSLSNCNERSCPYRVPGTPDNIDVNVAAMSADELRAAWPFGGLVDEKPVENKLLVADAQEESRDNRLEVVAAAVTETGPVETVPLPVSRAKALAGEIEIAFVPVEPETKFTLSAFAPVQGASKAVEAFSALFSKNGDGREESAADESGIAEYIPAGLAEYLALLKDIELGNVEDPSAKADSDREAKTGSEQEAVAGT